MADKKNRIDNLHDQMPALYNTRVNDTWKAIVEALGQADQDTLDLIEGVREQFFVKTAGRPYLDRLGTANLVQRPRFVGMEDTDFRRFIPVMSYQPKQVKLVLDSLLDLFFFQESTTSFMSSGQAQPFVLQDGWELEYEVDSTYKERIEFRAEEFTDISNATANEIVAAINRQTTNSYAIAFEDSLTKLINVKIFTNTVGSKGSLILTGGRANIGLQFEGYNTLAGQGAATEWEVTKVGDTVSLRFTGSGGSPAIDNVQIGDIIMINRPGNEGSFVVTNVDTVTDTIKYTNLFATEETFVQSTANDVKFFTPIRQNIYLRDRKAAVWEVRPGEIIVEMPPSPPVVKRNRKGSAHISGTDAFVVDTPDRTTLELTDASNFPESGKFFFIPKNEIQTFFPVESDTTYFKFNSKLSSNLPTYTYSSKSGNVLQGISPQLPVLAGIGQVDLVSADRDSNNIITATTVTPHDYSVGDTVVIDGAIQGATSGFGTSSNETFFATYDTSINADRSGGDPVPKQINGSPYISSGQLIIDSTLAVPATYDSVDYDGADNVDLSNDFQIDMVVSFTSVPPPAAGDAIFGIGMSTQLSKNSIQMIHRPLGMSDGVQVLAYDENGAVIFSASKTIGVVPGQKYRITVTGSSVSGFSLRVDGSSVGNNIATNLTGWTIDNTLVDTIALGSLQDGALRYGNTRYDWFQIKSTIDVPGDFAYSISDPTVSSAGVSTNGAWKITEIVSDTVFKCYSFSGSNGARSSTGGTARVERIGLSNSGSIVVLSTAVLQPRRLGPYMWDENSDFVLSSLTTNLTAEIEAGTNERNIQVEPNDIPDEEGRLIFDFGTEKQEGPVRYFFKPSSTAIQVDPSYVFKYTHDVGSAVTMIRRRGGIRFSGLGIEYGAYITDPAAAREVLQELMQEVKSVGIFINFLIRYPQLFYATIDVYRSGEDPG